MKRMLSDWCRRRTPDQDSDFISCKISLIFVLLSLLLPVESYWSFSTLSFNVALNSVN